MTQAILREDLEFALDTQINKIRLLKDLPTSTVGE